MIYSGFDARKVKEECIQWIRDYFEENGKGCNAVIGISGGKDSSIAAALCVEALGKERVIGVLMPQGNEIEDALRLVEFLDIKYLEMNIDTLVKIAIASIDISMIGTRYEFFDNITISDKTKINLPARMRMLLLYGVAQSCNGRVVNTCNLSEITVGYSTRWGDDVGDFSPLGNLTVSQVKQIGHELGIPKFLIERIPEDGLSGKTDEENLGVSYDEIDKYIINGTTGNSQLDDIIKNLRDNNIFKQNRIPKFSYE
ncbi:NAD(+) synthase [Anaerovoracaceae bacterium 41-7]